LSNLFAGVHLVIVPNERGAESNITSFDMPGRPLGLLLQVRVSHDSDPDHVEDVLLEEARRAAGDLEGLLAEPPPLVLFMPGFGAYSLDFTLICQVASFVDQFAVQHEVRKRILRRLRSSTSTSRSPSAPSRSAGATGIGRPRSPTRSRGQTSARPTTAGSTRITT
jgi:small-conductance mechanosensitive channel